MARMSFDTPALTEKMLDKMYGRTMVEPIHAVVTRRVNTALSYDAELIDLGSLAVGEPFSNKTEGLPPNLAPVFRNTLRKRRAIRKGREVLGVTPIIEFIGVTTEAAALTERIEQSLRIPAELIEINRRQLLPENKNTKLRAAVLTEKDVELRDCYLGPAVAHDVLNSAYPLYTDRLRDRTVIEIDGRFYNGIRPVGYANYRADELVPRKLT